MSETPKARVVIRASNANRGPGTVVAIIEDAQNIAASTYFNAPGEFHMTLPIHHPQLGKCDPWRTHYAVEEHYNGNWVQRFEGIISDFDANQDDVIVYGIDYLALFDRVIDTRYVQGKPEYTPAQGGSKHVSQTLTQIITNLLAYARDKANSPVKFISVGARDNFAEKVTIYSTFVGIREMIDGLVESHRQGTGKRSRFWIERYSGATGFRSRLADNPGVDRPNLRMEYGGLVQGFQIIGFGDWAVKAHGIGRTQTGYELFYQSANAPGINYSTATGYPAIETADVFDNVADKNDLLRRVKQRAMTSSRVGKRIALGLRVEHLSPFDGYGIADNIPVAIKRGSIDTTRWGSGYWSIYGVEWRVAQDGSTETTLVVAPKETTAAINADILIDNEALPAPIETVRIADGSISTSKLQEGAVTTPILGPAAVTNSKVAEDAIGTTQIQAQAVQNEQLGMGAVATPNFDPGAKAPLAEVSDQALFADSAFIADTAVAVVNTSAEVVINASGLEILNGKISLYDYGGHSVLGPAGFGGSWTDFLTGGTYNGHFAYGTMGVDFAVSEVDGADTEAKYQASLSTQLPYWIIRARSGTVRLVADANAAHGKAIQFSGTSFDGTIFQDVPVTPGFYYSYAPILRYTNSSSSFNYEVGWVWEKADRTPIIGGSDGLIYNTSRASYTTDAYEIGEAPSNAAYLRIIQRFARVSGSPTVMLSGMQVYRSSFPGSLRILRPNSTDDILRAGAQSDSGLWPRFKIAADGAMSWGNGTSDVDNILSRVNSTTMRFPITSNLQIGAYPALSTTQVGPGNIELRRTQPFIDFSNDTTSDYDMRIILESDSVMNILGGTLRVAGSGVLTSANHSHGSGGVLQDIANSTLLNGTTAAAIANTLLATGAPVGATHVVVRIECESTVAGDGNNIVVMSGLNAADIYGVAHAGAVASHRTSNVCIVPLDSSRRIYYRVGRVAGTVTYSVFRLFYLNAL